jgi:outer membrane protein assembly factor BamC
LKTVESSMKKYVVVALLANTAVLSGCGWLFGDKGVFRDRGDDYRRATVEAPLEVPPGLSKAVGEEDFAIPTLAYSAPLEGKFDVPRPEPLAGNPEGELVKIQRLDTSSWILVEAAPGEVWPRVRQFLTTNQLTVVRADATAGIIETAWLQPKTDGVTRERYRLRIEQGVQRGSSEVYVVQADSRAGDNWPAQSSNAERETEMIKAVAQFIADNGSAGAVSMLAQRGLDSKGKAFLRKSAGTSAYLELDLSMERAWASVTTALPKAGFTIEDTNHTERQVWVHFEPPKDEEEEKGWWSSFWSWVFRSAESTNIHKDIVYVLKAQQVGGSAENAVTIGVSRQDGKPVTPAVEEELLTRIKNKLA